MEPNEWSKVKSAEFDQFLEEIGDNEEKAATKDNQKYVVQIENNIDWKAILKQIGSENVNFVKHLITSKDIDINQQNPFDGKTLLIYAVIICNYDLVKVLCNFGADINIKDNDNKTALDYSIIYGIYRITELLHFRQLSGSIGNDIKQIAANTAKKAKQARIALKNNFHPGFMRKVIEEQQPFAPDLLFYAWYFECHREITHKEIHEPLTNANGDKKAMESDLWKVMMQVYEAILCNTHNKDGWFWLKEYFISSLIWFFPHPTHTQQDVDNIDDSGDDTERVLKKSLFWELLVRVRKESKKQSDILLKDKIEKIKEEKAEDWKRLISYKVDCKYSDNARQDICGCLIPHYDENDLSEDKYPPSTHFSAKKHYDTNMYLNELLFQGNILDELFQKDIKYIAQQIQEESNGEINVHFTAGPVKTLTRSQAKVENDYISESYPTSAKILDINRCALKFKNIHQMLHFMDKLTHKIKTNNARSIVNIVRCKNGFAVYDDQYPQYTDIKLNVLVKHPQSNKMIIAEIQFLLDLMSDFKKVAHKLYSIERKFELVYQFRKCDEERSKFAAADRLNMNGVMKNLIRTDNIQYFKLLWNTITPTVDTLININAQNPFQTALFELIFSNNKNKIHDYIFRHTSYKALYYETILQYTNQYITKHGFHKLMQEGFYHHYVHRQKIDKAPLFLSELFKAVHNDKDEIYKLLNDGRGYRHWSGHNFTLIHWLCSRSDALPLLNSIFLQNPIFSSQEKKEALLQSTNQGWNALFHSFYAIYDECNENMMAILNVFKDDREMLLRLISQDNKHGISPWKKCTDSGRRNEEEISPETMNEALKFVLESEILKESEKWNLLKAKYKKGGMLLCAAKHGGEGKNVMDIFKFVKDDQEKLMLLLSDLDEKKRTTLHYLVRNDFNLNVIKNIADSLGDGIVKKLLHQQEEKGLTCFEFANKSNSSVKVLEFIQKYLS